jgi:DNA-binding transcriptional ArsR family regulator
MRSDPPPLMPIFRSRQQADLLTVLFLHPDQDHTVTALATQLAVPLTSAHRELQRLEEAGLLIGRQVGRSRLLRANLTHPAATALTQLLLVTFGPQIVVAEEFGNLARVSHILVYGSWAARYQGLPGGPPGDVDVLVVGTPARTEVYAAAERAEARLGLTVNPTIRSLSHWENSDDHLVQSIRANPDVDVGPDISGTTNGDDSTPVSDEIERSA